MWIKLAGICLVFIGILVFIGFSYMENRNRNMTLEMYKEFQAMYKDIVKTSMGICRDSVFTKEVILMIAVNDENRIMDARMTDGSGMETKWRTCEEYMGMDLEKYLEKKKEKKSIEGFGKDDEMKTAKERAFDMAVRRLYSEKIRN